MRLPGSSGALDDQIREGGHAFVDNLLKTISRSGYRLMCGQVIDSGVATPGLITCVDETVPQTQPN